MEASSGGAYASRFYTVIRQERGFIIGRSIALAAILLVGICLFSCTPESIIFDDYYATTVITATGKSIDLHVDHHTLSLFLMLAHFYPDQFSIRDQEIADLIGPYIGAKNQNKRCTFPEHGEQILGVALNPVVFQQLVFDASIGHAMSNLAGLPPGSVSIHMVGIDGTDISSISSRIHDIAMQFFYTNKDRIRTLESDILRCARRRLTPPLQFLSARHLSQLLPGEQISILLLYQNNLERLDGTADYSENKSAIRLDLNAETDALVLFHELTHLWNHSNDVTRKLIELSEALPDKGPLLEDLRRAALALDAAPRSSADSARDAILEMEQSELGYGEFFAYAFSEYLFSAYSRSNIGLQDRLPRFSSITDETWTKANELYRWIEGSKYFAKMGRDSNLIDINSELFRLYVLTLGRGLDYALDNAKQYGGE